MLKSVKNRVLLYNDEKVCHFICTKCDACERHSNRLHQATEPLHPIISTWLFMKSGMDIVGRLSKAPVGKVFMLVMINYFSKRIHAEAFVPVQDKEVVSFIK